MKAFFTYFRRNILLSVKSVLFSFKHYVWFFAALIVIQCFFCTLSISSFNNNSVQFDIIKQEYNYHYIIRNATEEQYYVLLNDKTVRYDSNKFYEIVKAVQKGREDSLNPIYDLYIYFKFDAAESYEKFCNCYGDDFTELSDSAYSTEKTPLLDFSDYSSSNTAYYVRGLILITVLGTAFTYALYYIRTGYFKFTYGIFMSFGGGFCKIYSTSFWEMMFLCFLAFVPSSIVSTLLMKYLYSARGITLTVHFSSYFISIFLSLLITAIALIPPCLRISKKTPISNLIAGDNSDKVSSPRNSCEFFRVTVPHKYSAVSSIRFRKHHSVLGIFTAVFTCVFVLVFYATQVYCASLVVERPEYSVNFTDNTYANNEAEKSNNARTDINKNKKDGTEETSEEEFSDTTDTENTESATETEPAETDDSEASPTDTDTLLKDYKAPIQIKDNYFFTDEMENGLMKLDGIKKVVRQGQSINTSLINHVLIPKNDIVNQYEYTYFPDNPDYGIYTNVEYHPINWEEIKTIFKYRFDGDIYDIPENGVIVTNSVAGNDEFKFQIEDKIKVAEFLGTVPDAESMSDSELLSEQLKKYNFEYIELSVAAVMYDMPENENVVVYIPEDLYNEMFGEESASYVLQIENCRSADIYVDTNLTPEELNTLSDKLTDMFAPYGNCVLTENHAGTENRMAIARNTDVMMYSVAILSATVAPLVVLFSMRMFNIKREEEFRVITAIGFPRKKVRQILSLDSLLICAFSLIIFIPLTFAGSIIINKIMNSGFAEGVSVRYSFPILPFIIGALLIILVYYLSALISYGAFKSDSANTYRINLNA